MATQKKPLRVLQINSGNRYFGGVSSIIYNIYSHIDRDKVQFDFLTPYTSTYNLYRDAMEAMGGNVYELGIGSGKLSRKLRLYPQIKKFLKANDYRVVHINSGNFFFNLIVSKTAKDVGIQNIIVHSHNIGDPRESKLKKACIRLLKPVLERQLTARCACSVDAARFMFLEKVVENGGVTIVHNGIIIERFAFDQEARNDVRRQLGIEDKHVLGMVGRVCAQKNQTYLVKVFSRLAEQDPDAVLVMLGDGDQADKDSLKKQVVDLNLIDRVLFLGTQKDIERYYQAFDAFAFPSIWEGLGMVLVEAQIAGLHCVASTAVPKAANVTGNVVYIDTDQDSIDDWVNSIKAAFGCARRSYVKEVREAGYDINEVAAGLAEKYLGMAGPI